MDPVVQHQFGTWLKQQRKLRNLTQEELAERMLCSSAMVRKIESGERVASQQMAELLAESFGIAPGERPAFIQFAQGRLSADVAEHAFWQILHTVQAHPTNLTAPLTALIGRERELETLHRLLLHDGARLFTLTGPPGIGKTRLSLQVGIELLDHFRDGVFFVALATLVDPDLVAATIAQALGFADKSAEPYLTILQRAIGSKQMLLVLDNFEQVLDASPVIVELLGACPNLKIVITSREALHVYGEQRFPVPTLATADPANLPPIQTLEHIPAVALFIERARAVELDFALTEETAGAVASVCMRLDGLPLAIELAAARIRLFSPREMQARIDSRLSLLTGGPRNLPARQRTLRAAIDWSYNLLNVEEQTLFARLGVFVGGCTLSAAEAICNRAISYQLSAISHQPTSDTRHPLPSQIDVSDGIESLLDKNLLKREEGINGESRFTMLELINEYSSSRLQASEEERDIRALHTKYFLALAEAARPHLFTGEQQLWLQRLEADQENLRAVLARSLAEGEVEIAARVGVALWRFWEVYGYLREGRGWLERILSNGDSLTPFLRGRTLNALGVMAGNQGDYREARRAYEEGLEVTRKSLDAEYTGNLHINLAQIVIEQGEYTYAGALLEEALGTIRKSDWKGGLAFCLDHLGLIRANLGDYGEAKTFYEESLLLRRGIGDLMLTGMTLCNLGDLARYQDALDIAAELYAEGLDLFRKLGDKRSISYALSRLALVDMGREDLGRSRLLQGEVLSTMKELQQDKDMIAFSLAALAALASIEGRVEQAIKLFAQSETLLGSLTAIMRPAERAYFGHIMAEANILLDSEEYTKVQAEGREMSMEQAIEYALNEG